MAQETEEIKAPKVGDLTFMMLMLTHHKGGAWDFKSIAEMTGATSPKSVENRYYKLKKLYFDNVGGADMLKLASGDGTPKKTKATPSKAATNGGGKKRRKQEEGGEDDEEIAESTPTKKLKEEEQVAGEEKADSKTGGREKDDYA